MIETKSVRDRLVFKSPSKKILGPQELILRFIDKNQHKSGTHIFVHSNLHPWGSSTLISTIFETHSAENLSVGSYTMESAEDAGFPDDKVVTPYLYSYRIRDVVQDSILLCDMNIRRVRELKNSNMDFLDLINETAKVVFFIGRY